MRNLQKALLFALLQPSKEMKKLQDEADFTKLMLMSEELKFYPFADVWDKFCEETKVPIRDQWYQTVLDYEKEVLAKRK